MVILTTMLHPSLPRLVGPVLAIGSGKSTKRKRGSHIEVRVRDEITTCI